MTPFLSLVKRWTEKLLGRWYEGPEPPQRLDELVFWFAIQNPRATRREWAEFARESMREAYRTAWIRGFEWSARIEQDPELPTPEQLADALSPGWREESEPIEIIHPQRVVEDCAEPEHIVLERQLRVLRRRPQ